jgi:hypothetical protein
MRRSLITSAAGQQFARCNFTCRIRRRFQSSAAVPPDPSSPAKVRRDAPWSAAIRAVRANLLPGFIVQGVMLAILVGYYLHPPLAGWLDALAGVKQRWSYVYSGLSAIVAGAFIPELMRIFIFQKARVYRLNYHNLLFTIPYWCAMGVAVDFLYRCQAGWFGEQVTFAVVFKKVMVDQFIYNPLFAAPLAAWLYDWKNRGFPRTGLSGSFTAAYYRHTILPILFATWGVWIPVVAVLYSLPTALQIPLFALALSIWVMIYTWMSEQRIPRMNR